MLRAIAGAPSPGAGMGGTIRVSSGSAVVLGLECWGLEVAPTTAYLMVGGRCSHNCAFCAQARGSVAPADRLSRVSWPSYPAADVLGRLGVAFEQRAIRRACLQVTAGPGYRQQARLLVQRIKAISAVPVCVCTRAQDLGAIDELLALGAERVTLALDAASERVYNRVKGRDWRKTLDLLLQAARRNPGRVGTHVIVGLGESEAEAVKLLQNMQDAGVMTALFAFTPVAGTALAHEAPPPLATYRRLQAARYLIFSGRARAEQFSFSSEGRLVALGLDVACLEAALGDGQAFETSGCPGCNRPYYNERSAGPLFNYPRPLQPEEAAAATALAIESLMGR